MSMEGFPPLQLEKSEDIKSEEELFLESYDLSPAQRGEIKKFIEKLKDPKTSPIYLRDSEGISREIKKSEYIKNLAKKVFYNAIVKEDGCGTGNWEAFKSEFDIEEQFFKQPDFVPHKRKRWIEKISNGSVFDTSYNYDTELSLGEMDEARLSLDMPEVKNAAAKGVINSLFSPIYEEKQEMYEKYTEKFNLNNEDLIKVLDSQPPKLSYISRYKTLRKKYGFIDEYLQMPSTIEKAKLQITNLLVNLNLNDAKELQDYFSVYRQDLDQSTIEEKESKYAFNKLLNELKTNHDHSFYVLESTAKYISKEDLQLLYRDKNIATELIHAISVGLLYDWDLDKNIELFKNIELPQELFHQAKILAIKRRLDPNNNPDSPEKIKEFSEKIGLSEHDIQEGLSLAILQLFSKNNNVYEIKRRWQEWGVTTLTNSPEIQKYAKEMYLKKVEQGKSEELSYLESIITIDWKLEENEQRRTAVKNLLLDEYTVDKFNTSKQLNSFIETYYPDRHNVFLISDPEVQKSMLKKLSNDISYEIRSNKVSKVLDFANYFAIPLEKIGEHFIESISEKNNSYLDLSENQIKLYKTFGIDFEKHNKEQLQKNGKDIAEKAFEDKNWNLLKTLKKHTETKEYIEKQIDIHEDSLYDETKSIEIRKYALEALVHLSSKKEYSDLSTLISADAVLTGIAQDPHFISKIQEIVKYNSLSFLNNNWSYLYAHFKKAPKDNFEKDIVTLKNIEKILDSFIFKGESFSTIADQLFSYDEAEQSRLWKIITKSNESSHLPEDWTIELVKYINTSEELGYLRQAKEAAQSSIELFSGEYKNEVLVNLQKEWKMSLNNKKEYLSPSLFVISKLIDDAGGAGTLKHVESLGNFIHQYSAALQNKKTVSSTKAELQELLQVQQGRQEKEKWSQDDISEFYNLSHDILEASPSLYNTFSPIFETLSPKDLKIFHKELLPLYQAQLVIIQEINGEETTYNPRNLVEVRHSLERFAKSLNASPKETPVIFENEKTRLGEVMKKGFKNRFGLLKVPEEFTKEHLRSIQNGIRYIGNINERSFEREALIALYLGLELNNKWSDFREGKEIDSSEYFSSIQSTLLKPFLEKKSRSYTNLREILNINENDMPRFQEILQEDTISSMMGNVETIDIKLGNVKRNIDELIDPDIYETSRDKEVVSLLVSEGKNVGAVLAKTYAQASGKEIILNETEKDLQSKLQSIFEITQWNTIEVKKVQDNISPFSIITNVIQKMNDEKVEENINELQKRLIPSTKIIEIFNRLGEDFKQESGALALSKDLSYLESLIVKDEKKLTSEEKDIIKKYISPIREKMKDLEGTLSKVKEYFDKVKKSSHLEKHQLLKTRIEEIEKILYSTNSSEIIVSHMTKDLNLIIENMRQCLGCMRKEINNDTNLSFGDYNKFFMMNQSEKEKGSISDEIVFFVPTKRENNDQEMSFVMDQVYGSKSSDVLIGNILSIHKKQQALKKEYSTTPISIIVSNEALRSVGLSAEIAIKTLKEKTSSILSCEFDNTIIATIPESAFSDNYVEFGSGNARTAGERTFAGLIIH